MMIVPEDTCAETLLCASMSFVIDTELVSCKAGNINWLHVKVFL